MIPVNPHSPFPRIIHFTRFAVRRFFVNDRKISETAPRRPASHAGFSAFPGTLFRVIQCEYVIFSDMTALHFHSPEVTLIITNRNQNEREKILSGAIGFLRFRAWKAEREGKGGIRRGKPHIAPYRHAAAIVQLAGSSVGPARTSTYLATHR
ncbi:hypothetical protein KDW19_11860 [Burkholderia cenocepacia]|uniref:hypothetical protein n=1 Tax=Burkholderia cepacia complex TaxID=87882 RepID=UPI001626ED85|nr:MULTISPECIES: hypothetical protein [Burkholderia cepacia complex]ELW9449981.1 hypothetical protein [Burkholderia cenocepacia]MBR8483149.1 hypothetical protein [Burkholderia cenocepacia]MDN7470940.1 hypothetical protein [Burkholderia orbicola]MDN7504063.1 hypothetical protein [Burkholderia orbicola]